MTVNEFITLVAKDNKRKIEIYSELLKLLPHNNTFISISKKMDMSYPTLLKYLEPFKMFNIITVNKYKQKGYVYKNIFEN